jgi:predicted RNA-binding protein YlxR (DUF448 family)
MSALITREQPNASELYRASLETDASVIRIYASDDGEYWLNLNDTQRGRMALMNRSEAAALRDMLTEALEAQGVPA